MTTISQEEENYVRLSLLLSGISPRAVRKLFDSELDPSCLKTSIKKNYNKLKNLQRKRIINQSQWDLLFPFDGDPNSNMFDVTLMITLLTNLTQLNHCDKLPLVTDTTPSADLARIKYYRNHISHNKDGTISSLFFSTSWNDVIGAVGRLGGKNMLDRCEKLRTKILEQSTVPWNIRVQIDLILEAWKINDTKFVATRAAKHVFKCVQENKCVTITASSGVGKTAILRHVALQMKGIGYDILPVTSPQDILKFYNPNEKTLFVIDDFCGTYSMNQSDLDSWESVMERIEILIENKLTKIFVACRLQVYQDEQFKSLLIFRTCVCNLLLEDLCLSQKEKKSIAELYLETEASEIVQYYDLYDCFPLLCNLYYVNSELNITDFFQNPFSVYEAEIDKLHTKRHFGKYCALALCVMFNNELEEKLLMGEIEIQTRTTIEKTCEACRLARGTSRLMLLDELKSLEHTFIKKEHGVFKTLHDKIFDFVAFYFGQTMTECLIRNADDVFLRQRFLFERNDKMAEFTIVLPPELHQLYLNRMIYDWKIGRVQVVFNNINMKIPDFRKKFLCFLNMLDITLQRKLARICDFNFKDTALLQCCHNNYLPLIQWCIYHGVDVNQCNSFGVSPLFVSGQEGHTELVKLLMEKKADINKCDQNGVSPLLMACQRNHKDVVKLLLDNKADINKCKDGGIFPLLMACQINHIDIVKLLIDNKADINNCADNELSPLLVACERNNKE
ncbi:uncharacterized protein LOC127726586 [Mytilus californianus]|uniref:uncharacterized protein LOC127726586 n=1 Tax=Mytilus californianus TaxID=6549 RepID=UPI0022481A97|nr:uncharacterized protein LOC127726586 [Mytilus californianus]